MDLLETFSQKMCTTFRWAPMPTTRESAWMKKKAEEKRNEQALDIFEAEMEKAHREMEWRKTHAEV